MISGILLAAGHSKRMGEANKLLLPYKNEVLFLSSLKSLKNSILDEIIVVLGHDYKQMLPYIHDKNIRIAINGNHLEGQTSSIQAGIQLVNPSSKAFLIALADMPLISSEHINELIQAFERTGIKRKIFRPIVNTKPGNPILFCKSYYKEILHCKHPDGCKPIVIKHKENLVSFVSKDLAYITDIDTPEEYADFV